MSLVGFCSEQRCSEDSFKRCSECGKPKCLAHIDYVNGIWLCGQCQDRRSK